MSDTSGYERKTVMSHYIHIDNGGFTFKLDKIWHSNETEAQAWQEFSLNYSFFGYGDTTVVFPPHVSGDKLKAFAIELLQAVGK